MTKFRQVWLFWRRIKIICFGGFPYKYRPKDFLYACNTCGPWYLPWRMCSCHHPELRHWGSSLSLLHSAKFYCVSSVQSYLLSPHLHCIHITSTNTVYCTSSTVTCSHPQIVHNIYKRTLQRWNGSHSLCNPAGSLNQACLLHSHYFITKQKFSSPGILKLDHARG